MTSWITNCIIFFLIGFLLGKVTAYSHIQKEIKRMIEKREKFND